MEHKKEKKQQQISQDSDSDSQDEQQQKDLKSLQNIPTMTLEGLLKRDCIQKYLKNYNFKKNLICNEWFKGYCLFPQDTCIHAHGIEDIDFDSLEKNLKENSKIPYKTFPKLPRTEGLRDYVQLVEFAKQHSCHFKEDQWKTINSSYGSKEIKHKVRKQFQANIILESTDFLYEKYGKHLTLDIFNQIIEQIFVDKQWNQDKSNQQMHLWQKIIEKVTKMRKSYYVTKRKDILNQFQQPTNFIVKVPQNDVLDSRISQAFVQACQNLLKDQKYPLYQEQILEYMDNHLEIYENGRKFRDPTMKQYLEISNLRFSTFLEVKILSDLQTCKELGIPLKNFELIQQYYQNIHDKVINKKKDNDEDEDEEEDYNPVEDYFYLDLCKKKKRLTEEQKQTEIEQYLKSTVLYSKESLCRFYLRGCCRFTRQECKYSHDFDDLINFKKISQYDREIDFTYKIKDYDQRPLLDSKRVQYSLFEYQHKLHKLNLIDKTYTLEEITDSKQLRVFIRDKMHKLMMQEFYKILLDIYKDDNFYFTDKFLIGEYNRVGFNKIGNKITYKQILQSLNNVLAYDVQLFLPPLLQKSKQKSQCMITLPSNEFLTQKFTKQLQEIVKILQDQTQQQQVSESDIKKYFYKVLTPVDLPLHAFLIINNLSFKQFADKVFEGQDLILYEFDKEKVSQQLQQNIKEIKNTGKIVNYLSDFENDELLKLIFQNTNFSTEDLQTTGKKNLQKYNPKAFDFIRQQLLIHHNQIILFNPVEIYYITLENLENEKQNLNSCNCQHRDQQLLDVQLYDLKSLENTKFQEFLQQRIILVNSIETIIYSHEILVNQYNDSHLGVDLEGKLRLGGYVELIQISVHNKLKNNEIQIFVFDIQELVKDKENLYFQSLYTLNNIFTDKTRTKIFHDCRRDSEAIHFILGICVQNVFDNAPVDMLISHMEQYGPFLNHKKINIKEQQCSSLLKKLEFDIKWPGLNDILDKYQATHGINATKNEMHAKFSDPQYSSYFKSRPIKQDYLEYSARDVEDLIEVKKKMVQTLQDLMINKYKVFGKKQQNEDILKKKVEYYCSYISNDYSKDCFQVFQAKLNAKQHDLETLSNNQHHVILNAQDQLKNIIIDQQ